MRTQALLCQATLTLTLCFSRAAFAQSPAPGATSAAPTETVKTQVNVAVEEKVTVHEDVKGVVQFMIGPSFLDVSKLNDNLRPLGYGKLSAANLTVGGHAHAVILDHFIIGGTGAYFTSAEVDGLAAPPSRAKYTGGWGGVDLGYALVDTHYVSVSPMLTLGGYSFSFETHETAHYSFAQAIKKPPQDTTLSQGSGGFFGLGGVLIGLAVPIDFHIPLGATGADQRGLVLGVRPGGLLGIQTGGWRHAGTDAEGPTMGLRGGYVLLTVGAGS